MLLLLLLLLLCDSLLELRSLADLLSSMTIGDVQRLGKRCKLVVDMNLDASLAGRKQTSGPRSVQEKSLLPPTRCQPIGWTHILEAAPIGSKTLVEGDSVTLVILPV